MDFKAESHGKMESIEKFLNYRCSRMAKIVKFCPW